MKKKIGLSLALLLVTIFLSTGCTDMMNTPSKRVEEFMGKYQTMDSDVLTDLDEVVDNAVDYSEEGKKEYKNLMQKQYQNLSYKIKDEATDGDKATVEVEVEVFDYGTALTKADSYIKEHADEFKEEKDKSRAKKMEEHRIKAMKAVTDKAHYTITFNLTKENKTWVLEAISDSDLEKLHGLYKSV